MEQLTYHGGPGMILLEDRAVVTTPGWLLHYDTASCAEDRFPLGQTGLNAVLGGAGSVAAVQLEGAADALEIVWWDLASGRAAGRLLGQGTSLSVEGTILAPPAAIFAWVEHQPLLAELDLDAGQSVMHELPWLEQVERGFSVAAPAGSRQVLVLDHEGPAVVYDLDRKKLVRQLSLFFPHTASVQTGAGDSLWLVDSQSQGGLVQVDPRTWNVLQRWDVYAPFFLAVDPSGHYGAVRTAGTGRKIVVVDLQTRERVSELELPKHSSGWTRGPCLLTDGRLVTWSTSAGFEIISPTENN